jgi:hypothetical protein
MMRDLFVRGALAVALCLAVPATTAAAAPPPTWDNLVLTPSKRLKAVYLAPNADFRAYTKVMIDPSEVAFNKDWARSINSSSVSPSARVDSSDAQRIVTEAQKEFDKTFSEVFAGSGYTIVTSPGPDVLRLRPAVLDLYINAPFPVTDAARRVYTVDAGRATFVIEVRDSVSGAVIGRAVDQQIAGDNSPLPRSRMSNRADFDHLFQRWAAASVKGLAELKALSGPVQAAAN